MGEEKPTVKLLIATGNPGKRREMEALLTGLPVEVLTPADFADVPDVVEDGVTLEQNAAKKASETARACGMHTVADDSGLFVDALDGRPGMRSARYAGGDSSPAALCGKLLREMRGVPTAKRGAHFQCCIAMSDPTGQVVLTASGRCDGRIADRMRGDGGFGYDAVFYFDAAGKTFAELQPDRKNAVSHRGKALAEFRRRLIAFLG